MAVDLAVDPTSNTYAVKAAGASKRGDYSTAYEAALRSALEAKPGADGAAPDDAAKKAARAGGIAPLAGFLEAKGRFDEAVDLRKELAAAKPDACATWTSLGAALVSAVFPKLLFWVSGAIGVAEPVNLLFFVTVVLLVLVSVQLSYELSRHEDRIRRLAEEVALLDQEIKELRSRRDDH